MIDVVALSPTRRCTDEEYSKQQRCFYCNKYSVKAWADEDHTSGKCFAVGLDSRVRFVDGNDICNQYQFDETFNEN